MAAPALVLGVEPRLDGDRCVFATELAGAACEVSMPQRPRAWMVVAGEVAGELLATDLAVVRVGDEDSVARVARELRRLPEARGVPVVVESTDAAAALGVDVAAVIAERPADRVVLTPTLILGEEPVAHFLDRELPERAGALNHERRRLVARAMQRSLRRGGAARRSLRAALAALASALAFTLSMGVFTNSAHAVFTAVTTLPNSLAIYDDVGNFGNGVTLDCVAGEVSFNNGSGPETLPETGPGDPLECTDVTGITVLADGGADTVDLGSVVTSEWSSLGLSFFNRVSIDGAGGQDSLDAPDDFPSTLVAAGANDTLDGSTAGDLLLPGAGVDTITARGGADTLSYADVGGAGVNANLIDQRSTLSGDTDNFGSVEHLVGSPQADTLVGPNAAATSILGGASADTITGSSQADSLGGDAGADSISALQGADSVLGGSEADTLDGGIGTANDTLVGEAGTDSIVAGNGNDSMSGGTQNDTLEGGDNDADTLNGGDGTADFASYVSCPTSVTINLATDSAICDSDTDTLTDIENAVGSTGNDSIAGDAAANTLLGGDANDTISADSGNDSVSGEAGTDSLNGGGLTDTIDGGPGNDTIDSSSSDPGAHESLVGGADNDTISAVSAGGGATITGNAGLDTIAGNAAADNIDGGTEGDSLDGNAGNDTISAGSGGDTVIGDPGADSIAGGSEGDTIQGLADADTITGDAGDDSINAGLGADSIDGGLNADRLIQSASFPFNPTLTDSLITGQGPDSIDNVERVSMDGTGTLDASAFTGDGAGVNASVSLAGAFAFDETLYGSSGSDLLDGGGAGANGDFVAQIGGTSQTLTNTQLTGDGVDTLTTGVSRVSLVGEGTADDLNASAFTSGPVTLWGGGADDTLRLGIGLHNDEVNGQLGTDRLVMTRDSDLDLATTLLTGAGSDSLTSVEQASLTGGAAGNLLDAADFGGSTTLSGLGGNDTIVSGPQGDSLDGGANVDRIQQTSDNAQALILTAMTGTGNDTLAGFETASLSGGSGSSAIDASGWAGLTETVTLTGGAGNDTLTGSPLNDRLVGGADTDRIIHSTNTNATPQILTNSTLTAGGEQDTLDGIEQASLPGGAAAQSFNASAFGFGSVTISAAGGNDTIVGSSSSDSLDGGADTDRILQSVNGDQTLTNSQLTGLGTDTIALLESADIGGGSGANFIDMGGFSGGGGTTVSGGTGSDTIVGSASGDFIDAGAGDTDRFVQAGNANQTVSNTAASGVGNDTLNGSFEQAMLTGGASGNTLNGSTFPGRVTLDGLAGDDSLLAAGFADSLSGGEGTDSLNAGAGANTVSSGAGADNVTVGGDTDRLVESADADMTLTDTQLTTGAEVDTLTGGIETASLSGGAGDNVLNASAFSGATTLFGSGGADTLNSDDAGGPADANDCGPGDDSATTDTDDTADNCETVNGVLVNPPDPPTTTTPTTTTTTPTTTTPVADTKAPVVEIDGESTQKDAKAVKIEVTADEASAVEVTGTIKVPAIKGKRAKTERFDLKPTSANVASNQTAKLKLKFSGAAKKLVKKAIKKKASKVKVSATATDAAGNSATSSTLKIKVQKK